MKEKTHRSGSTRATQELGKKIGSALRKGDVLVLRGPLGAGKTTLAQGIISAWGVPRSEVNSPSFVYVREYPLEDMVIYHCDLYRMQDPGSILDVDYLDMSAMSAGIVLIEWPERMPPEYLPDAYYEVQLEVIDLNTRQITVSKRNAKSQMTKPT